MNLEEQNKFAAEFDKFLSRKLKGEQFHAIITVGKSYEDGFAYSIGTLSKNTAHEACDMIAVGISEEAKRLLNQFKIPSNRKIKKPIQHK